ncbi:MAG: P-II family nitrogen regulator [Actinobacteria bacterium]|nr:P-II family nitrogen regulator [Actinomycetota bacterium]
MEMVRALIRPERESAVIDALEKEGFVSLTKMHVFGRGRQKGLQVGPITYDELPKVQLTLVVNDEDTPKVVGIIEGAARTGNIGDGKIFVSEVSDVYTIRTGEKGL